MRTVYRLYVTLALLFYSLTSHSQLNVNFSMDRTGGCSPLRVNFTNISMGASANATYSWDLGNGNHSSLQNPSAIYTQEKSYTVTLTVTDNGKTATQSKTLTVYKKPVVDFSVASPKVCLPASALFNSTSTAGDGYITSSLWDFGDGITEQSWGNAASHAYSVEQTATVGLTVTNSFGCQASAVKKDVVEILPRINAVFTSDKSLLCALSDSVTFTNSSTGPGTLQYRWDFGDGTTSTQTSPSHQFTKKAVYPVQLTVSNADGCSVTSYPVQVNAAYFNTDFSSKPLCREVGFNSTSYLYPSNSLWNFGDGTTLTSWYNITHTYTTPGTYNVTLINTYGACKDTVTKSVTVQETVNFNSGITMPAAVCLGANVDLTSTSSTPPSQINWDFGDGIAYTTSFPATWHTYSRPGTYTVRMTNVFGTCSETITKTIVVNALPNPQGFLVNYGGVCGAPVTVKFSDTTSDAVSWKWYMDYTYTAPFATTKASSYPFTYDGYHTVTLTVTNAAGCSASVSKSVNVFRPDATIYYSYSSSPRGAYDCDSLRIHFGVNSNQTIQSYSWNLGNGSSSTDASPEAFYDKPGIYPVTLNYTTESGCKASTSYSVRVYDKPKANFTYNIPCGNSLDLQFQDASFFSDNWQWQFGDGGYDYYSRPVHSYRDTGLYSVQFISHIGHCSDTIVKTVQANILPSSVSITKAENTCSGNRGTVMFDQYSLRATGMTWDFGDGTSIPYDTSVHVVTHAYKANGTYTVRLTGKYGNCILTSTATVRVLLKQSPVLTANKTQLCANDNLTIQINGLQTNTFVGNTQWGQYSVNKIEYDNGTAHNGYFSYYDWNYTSYTATLNNFAAGVSKLRAIVNSGYPGCTDTTNYINLQVNGPVAGFKVQNKDLCFKSAFVFTDTSRSVTSTQLTSWFWDFGDGITQLNTSNTPVKHTYQNPGQYTVRLQVTDAIGCSTNFASAVNASGTKAAFTPSGLYIPNVPLNTTVTFYNNSNSYNTNPTYLWTYGDGASETVYSGSHTYTKPGVNTVQLIVNDASIPCADTAQKVISVKDFNTAFSFSTSFLDAGSCPPVMVRINNLSVGYTRLKWDFGDGTTTTSAYYPSHIYQKPGTYKITLYTYGYNDLTGVYVDSVQVKRPSAQISADLLKGCLSQTVNLQANTLDASNYVWDFGDGVVNNGSTALPHAYNTPGLFTPRLIATNENSCATSADLAQPIVIDSLSVKIKDLPTLLCDSALIQFNSQVGSFAAANLGTPLQYQWNFGTGSAADTSGLPDPSFRFSKPGSYTVRLRVTSPYGCSKETSATLLVNEKAKGRITALSEICQDGSVQFAAAASISGSIQWNWTFGNGNTATVQNPPAQVYTSPGTYPVSLILTRNGCIDTVVHTLMVHPKPVINAQPKQTVLCLGDNLTLSAGGGTKYQWTPSTGLNNAAIANPVASPAVNTNYQVLATTDKGCTNKDSISITVGQPVQVQLPAAFDLCQGNTAQLTASGAASYQWIGNVAGLNNTGIANPVVLPPTTSVYTVVGTDQYNCFHDTARVTITVRDLPTVNAGSDLQVPGNMPYQLTAAGSPDVTSWRWSPADGLSCADCPSPVLTPKMEMQYVVTVRNQWGCTAADSLLVKLDCATDHVYFPNAFTPNRDGKNDAFYVLGSGVKTVRYLRIYSRWGDLVFERTNFAINDRAAGWNGLIKGQPVDSGTYVYVAELECSSGYLFTRKGTVTVVR
jgi:gliding motility-associated-like protein